MNYSLRRGKTASMLSGTRSMISLEFARYLLRSREQGKEVVAWVFARSVVCVMPFLRKYYRQ